MMRYVLPIVAALGLLTATASAQTRLIDVEPVWAGHPVGFCLLTHGDQQFVAYYDAQRRMTVAQRALDSDTWTFTKLPRVTGWDSHNYITMAIDREGFIHLSGDMHCVPLYYLRSTEPMDASTLVRVDHMVGPERERRATYPVFLRTRDGALIFRYRDGSSGNGDDLYNLYDEKTKTWRRLMDEPLTAGLGKMNAYCSVPRLGPDGRFHIVWIWRNTPDCATNHDVTYARSDDLVHWTDSAGKPLVLPININTGDIVDPVGPGGGAINGNVKLGFDHQHRPIVTYHKYDAQGHTQIYAARREATGWNIVQVSDWDDYRWDFSGGGSIVFEVSVGGVEPIDGERLTLHYRRPGDSGTWVLDEKTLKPIAGAKAPPTGRRGVPATLRKIESDFPGLRKHVKGDLDEGAGRCFLTWETLDSNRDRPRKDSLPGPSMLRVIDLGS